MYVSHRQLTRATVARRPARASRLLGLSLFTALALTTAPSFAQSDVAPMAATGPGIGAYANNFGQAGQIVISNSLGLIGGLDGLGLGVGRYEGGTWVVVVQPALDYFVAPNISVGGLVGLRYTKPSFGDSNTELHLGARAGYNLVLTDVISLWATLGIKFVDPGVGDSFTSAKVFAPFLFHPVPHFFVGLGPSFEQGLSDSFTNFGLESLIGGYL